VIIEDTIAAIILGEIGDELFPGGRSGGLLLNLNFLVIRSDAVDNILETLAELEFVEDGGDFVLKIDTSYCHCCLIY